MKDLHLQVSGSNARFDFPELARIGEVYSQNVEQRGERHQAQQRIMVIQGADAKSKQQPVNS